MRRSPLFAAGVLRLQHLSSIISGDIHVNRIYDSPSAIRKMELPRPKLSWPNRHSLLNSEQGGFMDRRLTSGARKGPLKIDDAAQTSNSVQIF